MRELIAVYTVVARNHLYRARALMASVEEHLPEAERWIVVVDSPAPFFDPAREHSRILGPDDLEYPEFRRLAFEFDAISICCAAKPIAGKAIRRRSRSSKLLYLDSDTLLVARPESLIATLDENPIVLTPHVLFPEQNRDLFIGTMRSGAYNGGVYALRAAPDADLFLDWWEANATRTGALLKDYWHDQGWLNHVPALFGSAAILRDPGCNVAFWNMHEREVTFDPGTGRYFARGQPLTLVHFSHYNRGMPQSFTGRMKTRFPAPPALLKLSAEYGARLEAAGAADCSQWPYGYGSFSDGKRITRPHREYFESHLRRVLPAGADPFDAALDVPGFTGLRSLYHADHVITRSIRRLRDGFAFAAGGSSRR